MLPSWTNLSYFIGLFLGMAGLGEFVLVPGVYIGYISGVSLFWVFVAAIIFAVVSDAFWFLVGRLVPIRRLMRFRLIRREKERARVLEELYHKHKLRMIFYSKFTYGTQIFFQVAAGANGIPFLHYISVSLFSTIIWFLGSALLTITIGWSLGDVKDAVIGIEIALSITLLIGIASFIALRWLVNRRLRSRSRNVS